MHEQRAFRLLGQFQVLEHSLKIYLHFCFEIVRIKLAGAIPFNHYFEQVENFPLERLSTLFSRYNNNQTLQKRIGRLVKHRNDVAHRAMLYNHGAFAEHFEWDKRRNHFKDLTAAEDELDACMEELAKEMQVVADMFRSLRA
jgi:hypothetical protein